MHKLKSKLAKISKTLKKLYNFVRSFASNIMRSVPFQTKASLLLSLGGVAFICEIVKNQFHPQEPVLAVHR